MLDELRARCSGPVLVLGDAGLADEVAAWNTATTHAPDVVVAGASPADVVEAVQLAAAEHLPIAVQATGHGAAPVTSGLLVSTRHLAAVTVDPEGTLDRLQGVRERFDPAGLLR